MTDLLLWADLETEGLYPWNRDHRPFEIGVKVTDLQLNVLHQWSSPILWSGLRREDLDPFILDMHTKNGLLDDMEENGLVLDEAEDELIMFLEGWNIPLDRTTPVCGNSLRLDREFMARWMPTLDSMLSYRIIDVSSFKETCRRFDRALFKAYTELFPDSKENTAHRVLDDIDHSIAEYKFYLEGMGWL
jgi:oligoribonuclease